MIGFGDPAWLLLLPVPAAVWWYRSRAAARRQASGFLHSQAGLLASLDTRAAGRSRVPWLWLLGCTLIVLAMARPQWWDFNDPSVEPAHNVMVAVDVSGSMRAQDYVIGGQAVSRLEMLKRALHGFLDHARSMRVGLVVFGDDAMGFMPLTADLRVAGALLDEIDNSLAGERTALGDAIALAVQRIRSAGPPGSTGSDAARVLLLLTDGAHTAGTIDPQSATTLARRHGVRVYTVGIGSDDRVPFPRGPMNQPAYTELPLNESLLRDIAAGTGGAYYRVRQAQDMRGILDEIERLEKARFERQRYAAVTEWYWLPAVAALALLVAAERRRTPEAVP